MKHSLALFALVSNIKAVRISTSPDVYGPNGNNYTNDSADQELAQIGIDIHSSKDESSPTCSAGNWATVHWQGRLMDGRVVTDSRAELGGQPKTFNVGNS
jgi:FKBP-type peptidyl-prolyl cis-trans isomerase